MSNQKAFPTYEIDYEASAEEKRNVICYEDHGMDLRDYFAAKAMQGLLAHSGINGGKLNEVTETAYGMADKMMEKRETKTKKP